MTDYALAPLAWLFPAAVFTAAFAVMFKADFEAGGQAGASINEILLAIIAWTLCGVAALFVLVSLVGLLAAAARIVEWSARVRHRGLEWALIDFPWLLALCVGRAMVYFIVLPWCAGFAWIVIDSFR